MKKKMNTHRVVTFLTREELEFLDKLEKDIMFSTGRFISRSQILQDMAELLSTTHMSAAGIKSNEELRQRMLDEIARMKQKQEPNT